jgi:hypothetical protein
MKVQGAGLVLSSCCDHWCSRSCRYMVLRRCCTQTCRGNVSSPAASCLFSICCSASSAYCNRLLCCAMWRALLAVFDRQVTHNARTMHDKCTRNKCFAHGEAVL